MCRFNKIVYSKLLKNKKYPNLQIWHSDSFKKYDED